MGGFRWHRPQKIIGSLMLGVYDKEGFFHYLRVTSSFSTQQRKELVDAIAPYRMNTEQYPSHPWAQENDPGKNKELVADGIPKNS